jgi:hypothetical protein
MGIPYFRTNIGYLSSFVCRILFWCVVFVFVPYTTFSIVAWNCGIISTIPTWSDTLSYYFVAISTTCLFHTPSTNPLLLRDVVLTQPNPRWDVVNLTFFGTKCGRLISWGTLVSKGILHTSCLFIRQTIPLKFCGYIESTTFQSMVIGLCSSSISNSICISNWKW